MARPLEAERVMSYEKLIQVTLERIERDGLEALSMRKLAEELSVTPRALYHYVPNKEALVQAAYVEVLNMIEPPVVGSENAKDSFMNMARQARRICLEHRAISAYFLTTPAPHTRELQIIETLLSIFQQAGFNTQEMYDRARLAIVVVVSCIQAELRGALDIERVSNDLGLAREHAAQFPLIVASAPYAEVDTDKVFQLLLEFLAEGFVSGHEAP